MSSGSDSMILGSRSRIILILAVAAAALILYWPTSELAPLVRRLIAHPHHQRSKLSECVGAHRRFWLLPATDIFSAADHQRDSSAIIRPALLHGLNVAQHALNVALLGSLSWRLWGRLHWALAAGLLLGPFPLFLPGHHRVWAQCSSHHIRAIAPGFAHLFECYSGPVVEAPFGGSLQGSLFLLALLSYESAILFGAFAALVQWNEKGGLPRMTWRHPGRTHTQVARPTVVHFPVIGVTLLCGLPIFAP